MKTTTCRIAAVMLVLAGASSGCEDTAPAVAPAPSVAAPAASTAQPSAAPPAAEAGSAGAPAGPPSDFSVVAHAPDAFLLYPLTGTGMVDASGFLAVLDADPLRQDPSVMKGLPAEAVGAVVGRFPSGAWYVIPSSGRILTYKWAHNQWAPADLVQEDETLLDIKPWSGNRVIAAIAMPGRGLRFALAGGTPGVALPVPSPAPPSSHTERPRDQDSGLDGGGDGGLDGGPEGHSCKVKLVPEPPFMLAGLVSGQLFAAGYECTKNGKGQAVVERWAPGQTRGVIEPLPALDTGGQIAIRGILALPPTGAIVFGGGDGKPYLARFDGQKWSREEVPFTQPPSSVSVDSDGTLWVATPGGLWKQPAGPNWTAAALPSLDGSPLAPASVWAHDANDVWVSTKSGSGRYALLRTATAKPTEILKLPSRDSMSASFKTNRRYLATPACTEPYAHLLTLGPHTAKVPDAFPALKEMFGGKKEFAGAQFVVEDDGAHLYAGAIVPSVAIGEKVLALFRQKTPKARPNLFCHTPRVKKTIILD